MRRLWEQAREREDRGAALMVVALGLVLLMGMAAFGADLAWFYLNASRVQRAADAASLGGVVWLPGDESASFSTAQAIATQNGYTNGADNAVVSPARVTGELNQLEVTVTDTVPTFFLRVFGFHTQTITRTAVAEYIPPLKLGSPTNQFGNDPSCYSTNSDCAGNFWANIHATRTDSQMGDAYASYCAVGTGSNNGCAQNPNWRNTGYLYGLTPSGNSVTLQTLDMTFHNETGGVANGDFHRTGDHNDFCSPAASCPGQSVTINVYRPDPTPLDISDNSLACTQTYSPLPQVNPHDAPPFNYAANWAGIGKGWQTVCGGAIDTSASPDGIWVVQIVPNSNGGRTTVLGSGNQANSGLNRYSIRSNTGNLFALGDFSIYNNATGSTTSFYVAEVPDFYRGKTFVIELYDAGESAAAGTLQPIDPSGSVFNDGQCRIYSKNAAEASYGAPDTVIASGNSCQESVSPQEYNGRWLKFEMDLPVGYSCTDCWWKMNYAYPSSMNDTTTWRAYMIGNPIHLVP